MPRHGARLPTSRGHSPAGPGSSVRLIEQGDPSRRHHHRLRRGDNVDQTQRISKLAAISTRIAGILRGRYGGGPLKVKAYAVDEIIAVVMRGGGFTALEQTMMDSGDSDRAVRVVDLRHEFQAWTAKRYTEAIEELTGKRSWHFSAKRTSSRTSRWRASTARGKLTQRRAKKGTRMATRQC
jgi:uncharacterized protein YbcI